MFGYVIANLEGLTQAQKDRYKGCYCGLCRVLKQRHGFSGRLTLTYDMTFLVLLLSALYEADEERGMEVCPAHPLRKHFYWQTRYTEYAADMNVVLAYNNCRDDWQDDGSALKYWEAEALSARCAAVRARWPRQCAAIEQCMAELSAIEQADTGDPDAAANCFGRLMGELFVTDDLWDARLRPFGEALGRFIYLLDAVIDLPEDLRHGRYNPLRTLPNLAFGAGEIVGLMGRNGIGKTTLARTLCGLMKPLGGQICWHGRPANEKQRLHNSFLVMQDVNYQLFSDSVQEEILLGAAHPERCDEVMQALRLTGLADRHPMSLSGGQKQRVVVAVAMLSDKPLILLDEPTSGLDWGSMQQVGRLMQVLKAQGKTLLVITHDEELAAAWCDRVITLS